MKLGRLPYRADPRIPPLARYTRGLMLPDPPPSVDWFSKVPSWPMMANDQIGDCTIAAAGHCIEQWTAYTQPQPYVPDDDRIIKAYEQISGYVPGNADSDRGCAERDVLEHWANQGIAGNLLWGYAQLNCAHLDELRDAISWCGNIYLGLNLPKSAMENLDEWAVDIFSPIVGGHAVIAVGYNESHFWIVSWGRLIPATPGFLRMYLEEAYALVSKDFITAAGTTPAGLDWSRLEADVAAIKSKGEN